MIRLKDLLFENNFSLNSDYKVNSEIYDYNDQLINRNWILTNYREEIITNRLGKRINFAFLDAINQESRKKMWTYKLDPKRFQTYLKRKQIESISNV